MSAQAFDRRFLLPRPGRLLLRIGLGVVVPLGVLVFASTKASNLELGLFTTLLAVGQVAAALAATHKEILAASPSFFHGGLRRKLLCAQYCWAACQAAAVGLFIAFTYPDAGAGVTATAFGAALAMHALLTLAVLRLSLAYMLPFGLYYLFYALPWFMRAGRAGQLDAVLAMSPAWLAGGALLMSLLAREFSRPHLHRRLCGTMVLVADDILRPGRIQEFRRQGDRNRHPGEGPRWRQHLISGLLGRADVAQREGRAVAARTWQVLALDAAVNFSTRRRVLALIAVGLVAFMVFFGYYDNMRLEGPKAHWFAGLTFQAAIFPLFGLSVVLLSAPAGLLSRRNAFRSELAVIGGLSLVSLAVGAFLSGIFAAMAAVLPPVVWHGSELVFTAPPLHCLWLGTLLAPIAWLAVAVRPRPVCTSVNVVLGPAFVAGHSLLTLVPYRTSAPISIGISVAAFAIAFWMRRRWWARADMAV